MRRAARWLGVVAASLTMAACAQSSAERPVVTTSTLPAPTSTTPEPLQEPHFTLGATDVQAVDAPAELPAGTEAAVQGLLDRYLTDALVLPLRSGHPVGDVSGLFTAPVLDRLGSSDRAALFDDGLPRLEKVHVEQAAADLTALVGPDGLAVLVAGIHIVTTASMNGAPLSIERTGELELSPEGDAWKVTGYDITATRSGPDGVAASTTSTSAP